jgi:hypothetical protein
MTIGKLASPDLPYLDNVLLVEGLTGNLISISQLCDHGLDVNVNKSMCIVSSKDKEVMRGSRYKHNCYLWLPQDKSHATSYFITKEDEIKLCHQKLLKN